ncbi:MAG: ABC-type cobalt transport system, permease component CbiQ [Solidesulfovibrio magneticus str. Maddingley MBC34]|uniref:ABC-type cobalt transport system, permease component CbiQ n=1 Tax=Solidesulfovibrio magneticus str. Maddingley MBC34 TaxID=1206767 RepID=K6GW71_9BACT|nr:MAG: ABC-type cobalt transport system, permease component CbiQ [Solidesulfovibrio magneticus str. Maddingley MBC34]
MTTVLRQASALSKCAFAVSLSVYAFACPDWRILVGVNLLLAGLLAASRQFDRIVWLALGVCVASLPTLAALFLLGGVEKADTWREGLVLGLSWLAVFELRLLVMLLADILVVKWTTFSDLLLSLRALRLPGKLVLFCSALVTLLPSVFSLAAHVVEVQRCRGFDPKRLRNPKNFLPLFIPVFLAQLRRSTDLALSLELRGISGAPPARASRLTLGVGDTALLAAAVAVWLLPLSA